MKKKWIILLLTAILLLAACAKAADAPEAQSDQEPAPTGEAAATEAPAGNPYFTCTGTEYGLYPIIPPKERKAEAIALLNENRDALERAAKVALETGEMTEIQYHLYGLTETGMDAKLNKPEPEFVADAGDYLAISYPMAIDATQHDPGILYYVALIYTTNTEDQISEFYRLDVAPIDGNWFLETYFYAY